MQLNSRSFSSGRCPRPRPERGATPAAPARRQMDLRRGVWLAVAVMLLVAVAGSMQSWFVEKPEPVQSSSVRKPADRTRPDIKTRIKTLFGPPPAQRLNG